MQSFCILDYKEECIGYYHDGELRFDENIPESLGQTWKYSPHLKNKRVKYAYHYTDGKSLSSVCPDYLQEKWNFNKNRIKAFHNSFINAKVDLNEVCFYDLIPQQHLKEYCDIKCKIIDHIFETMAEPSDYAFRVELEQLIENIKRNRLKINPSKISKLAHKPRTRDFLKNLKNIKNHIYYDQYGSITGRLSAKTGYFPILTMDKNLRSVLEPTNDLFVELDYNSAEIRTLLLLSGIKDVEKDIHEKHMKELEFTTRDEAKSDFFSWLYGSTQSKGALFYKREYESDNVKKLYWDGERVKNIFGRQIVCDEFHSLNYIIQSTTSDLVLRQAIKLSNFLKNKRTKILALIHDSVILDVSAEDKSDILEMKEIFANNELGNYKVNISMGKDLSKLKRIV